MSCSSSPPKPTRSPSPPYSNVVRRFTNGIVYCHYMVVDARGHWPQALDQKNLVSMEPSISMPIEPAVKEELGLTASASSSYRLSYLSSSSRRVRRISPPLVSSHIIQKKGSETHSPSPPQISGSSLFKLFRPPSLLIPNEELQHASQRPAPMRMHKVIRGIFLLWTWFSIGYFSVSIFGALKTPKTGWRDQRSAVAHSSMVASSFWTGFFAHTPFRKICTKTFLIRFR